MSVCFQDNKKMDSKIIYFLTSRFTLFTITAILSSGIFYPQAHPENKKPGTVDIHCNGAFTEVAIDFNDSDHKEIWSLYIKKLLTVFPSLETDYDASIARSIDSNTYHDRLQKLKYLIPQIPKEYREEIEGMASNFSGGSDNIRADGKLSIDEIYYINLYVDIIMTRGCSVISVFGPSSVTGKNMVARLVDWYPRTDNAVFTIRNGDKLFVNIGRLLGSIIAGTAFNDDGIFAALLAAETSVSADFGSKSYSSVMVDMRYALEKFSTLERIAKYLSSREYTFSHQIFLADSRRSKVLENNLNDGGIRALRDANSKLGGNIGWEFDNAVAAVNTFFLEEHFGGGGVDPRWISIRHELANKLRNSEHGEMDKVTLNELKEIATSYDRSQDNAYPGSTIGDIYNSRTQHIFLFEPDTFHLELFFRNNSPYPIRNPSFTKVSVSLD